MIPLTERASIVFGSIDHIYDLEGKPVRPQDVFNHLEKIMPFDEVIDSFRYLERLGLISRVENGFIPNDKGGFRTQMALSKVEPEEPVVDKRWDFETGFIPGKGMGTTSQFEKSEGPWRKLVR